MLWRHLCLVRAWSVAGLLTCSLLGSAALAEPDDPAPSTTTETVAILDGQKAGDLKVELRGHGQDRVKLSIRNLSAKRLNVVLPPGLVASSVTGQGRAGGGFQSMGLGSVNNRPGSFGQFRTAASTEPGFQSVPAVDGPDPNSVTVPTGQTIEVNIPAVCLNYGAPTPTLHNKFTLMDVDQYSANPRVREAIRTLSETGTSHGVAQAVMWHVCNDLPIEVMAEQAGKIINLRELALAARFIDVIDSASGPTVDLAYLTESRIFVNVQAEGALAKDAARLANELDGLHVLGLPVRVVDQGEVKAMNTAPSLFLNVTLANGKTGTTQALVHVAHAEAPHQWVPLGKAAFTVATLEGRALAQALDHAVAAAFVTVKPAKRGVGSTTLKIDNRLPFTLAHVIVRTSDSLSAPTVPFKGLGIGPGRSALAPIQAPGAIIERVELNGL